jgi:hypothetical protein
MLCQLRLKPSGNALRVGHAADTREVLHHPLTFGDGELPQQEDVFARNGR